MTTEPDAAELAIRSRLIELVDGPPPVPPKPTARPKDWLDDILDATPEDAAEAPVAPEPATVPAPQPVEKPAEPRPAKPGKKKQKKAKPGAPRTAWDTRTPAPRQSLTEAWDNVPYRLRWLAYHASAAYLGWSLGLVGWATYVTGWIAHTGLVGPQAFFWYATAGVTVLVYRRTRGWWLPLAWLAAVPATSTVVGMLLYGTPRP